jgi:hypothetical protein
MAWIPPTQESEESKVSKINAAGLINLTLENLWKDCYDAMAKANLSLWNTKLDAIWLILGGDIKDNSPEDKYIMELDIKIYELGGLYSSKTVGFKKVTNENSTLQYQLLKRKSIFLRRLQNKQGKGTAYDDGDDDDFE